MDKDFVIDRLSITRWWSLKSFLAPRSLQVRAYKELYDYAELYKLLQKAATYWENFLIYTQVTAEKPSLDKWKLIKVIQKTPMLGRST